MGSNILIAARLASAPGSPWNGVCVDLVRLFIRSRAVFTRRSHRLLERILGGVEMGQAEFAVVRCGNYPGGVWQGDLARAAPVDGVWFAGRVDGCVYSLKVGRKWISSLRRMTGVT